MIFQYVVKLIYLIHRQNVLKHNNDKYKCPIQQFSYNKKYS